MSQINVKVSRNIEKVLDLDKQITFATSTALTATAREAQAEVIASIQKTFITRGPWYLPGNKFGIKIEPATKTDLHTAVKTDAYWLQLHETGGVKTPQSSKDLAIPTVAVRRTKRDLIAKSDLPRNLLNAFILNLPRGPALFIRRKTKGLVRLYDLERSVKIEKKSTVVEPTIRTFKTMFARILAAKIEDAFRTAK